MFMSSNVPTIDTLNEISIASWGDTEIDLITIMFWKSRKKRIVGVWQSRGISDI